MDSAATVAGSAPLKPPWVATPPPVGRRLPEEWFLWDHCNCFVIVTHNVCGRGGVRWLAVSRYPPPPPPRTAELEGAPGGIQSSPSQGGPLGNCSPKSLAPHPETESALSLCLKMWQSGLVWVVGCSSFPIKFVSPHCFCWIELCSYGFGALKAVFLLPFAGGCPEKVSPSLPDTSRWN